MFPTVAYARLCRRIVSKKATEVFGSAEHARAWLKERNIWLGATPSYLINTGDTAKVIRYLNMIEAGVYI